ncbi:hypothetical protein MNBD_GAMMA22-1533 [hydrothermal vent metagenome]|uniref:Uncharacterized protein n=1 Tax=hydrothermal vent metagenome TaxID=652676 RepID=A0A3B0ZUW3_9ZZZZ
MNNDNSTIIKQEIIKMIPQSILAIILTVALGFGYFVSLVKIPVDAVPAGVQKGHISQSNFIHTSLKKVTSDNTNEICHYYALADDLASCYNVAPLLGYCITPASPGAC